MNILLFKYKNKILYLLGVSAIVCSLFVPELVWAQTDFGVGAISSTLALGGGNLIVIVGRIINIVLGLLGIIALGVMIYGGYQWMTAAGDEDQIQSAKDTIINGTIGLAIILSAFAIVSFILNQFSSATGYKQGTGQGSPGNPSCLLCNYGSRCSILDNFYIQSITPSTKLVEKHATHMNNITIRAVFSQKITKLPSSNSTSTKGMVIERRAGNSASYNNVSKQFDVNLKHNDKVLVAKSTKGSGRLSPGIYRVTLTPGIKNKTGNSATESACSENKAKFLVDKKQKDFRPPSITNIEINGKNSGLNNPVYSGDKLNISARVTDRIGPNSRGGNSFVHLQIYKKGKPNDKVVFDQDSQLKHIYDGPKVDPTGKNPHGSSHPYEFQFQTWVNDKFATGTDYTIELTAYDIDNNKFTRKVNFSVYECKNCGGSVGSSCRGNADCKAWAYCGAQGQCVADPIITSIDPKDGAPGTWMTIKGKYFGSKQGNKRVELAPKTGKKEADWSKAKVMPVVQCANDTWNDSWILAQVPPNKKLTKSKKYAVRLRQGGKIGKDPVSEFKNKFNQVYDNGLMYRYREGRIEWAEKSNDGRMKYEYNLPAGTKQVTVNMKFVAESFEASKASFYLTENKAGNTTKEFAAKFEKEFKNNVKEISKTLTADKEFDKVVITSDVENNPGSWADQARLYYLQLKDQQGNVIVQWGGKTESTIDDRCSSNGSNKGLNATCESWFTVNDKSRPKLCSLEDKNGNNLAVPDELLVAKGDGFKQNKTKIFYNLGNNQALQGGITKFINSTKFDTKLPSNLSPGNITAYTEVEGVSSNEVPLQVIASSSPGKPVIETIIPSSTTKESLVTIKGDNFGSVNQNQGVYIHRGGASKVQKCFGSNKPKGCIELDTKLRKYNKSCSKNWSSTRIIARVPNDTLQGNNYNPGVFNVAVRNNSDKITNGKANLNIVSGKPRPGLCRIELNPGSLPGPTPLRNNQDVVISGINFPVKTPTLRFWQGSKDHKFITSKQVINSITSNRTKTDLPTTTPGGLSMSTGPIQFKQGGNSLNYQVKDCRKASSATRSDLSGRGYRCCPRGPEAGMWKKKTRACKGVKRTGGYAWRFATADIPDIPRVLEQCQPQNNSASIPSPSPRVSPANQARSLSMGRKDACVNANIQVVFNMNMKQSTINTNNIKLVQCQQEDEEIDCSNSISSDDKYNPNLNSSEKQLDLNLTPVGDDKTKLTILENNLKGTPKLRTSTWYRVKLSRGIKSLKKEKKSGRKVTSSFPLAATRPCGDGTAYCFVFKTSDLSNRCSLEDAVVNPLSYTTRQLGIVKNNRNEPLKYQVFGKADQACTVLNVQDLDWRWFGSFGNGVRKTLAQNYVDVYAFSSPSPVANNTNKLSSKSESVLQNRKDKAIVNAKNNTSTPLRINATTSIKNQTTIETVTGTSQLNIRLGPPEIIDKWPTDSCTGACPNSRIGAKFDRKMLTSTYFNDKTQSLKNIKLYECQTKFCYNSKEINQTSKNISISQNNVTERQIEFSVKPNLATSTWYKAVFTNGIKAVGGYTPQGQVKPGKSLSTTPWVFKTKSSLKGCLVDSVDTQPLSYFENTVGGKKIYQAVPRSPKNKCSNEGQRLDSSNYDWNWSTNSKSGKVANITNFKISDKKSPICNNKTCLLEGSDISKSDTPLCGNGKIEPGEDCDVAANIPGSKPQQAEIPGVSCSYSCLRPGNDTSSCYDGQLERNEGEECEIVTSSKSNEVDVITFNQDLNQIVSTTVSDMNTAQKLCSTKCTNKGVLGINQGGSKTNKTIQGTPSVKCYDGNISPGEDCDPSSVVNTSTPGCSSRCLNLGTNLSQNWCANQTNKNKQQKRVCNQEAVSVCGNGNLEPQEECELDGNNLIYRDKVGSTSSIQVNNPNKRCSSACKLKNICSSKFSPLSSVSSQVQVRCTSSSSPHCSTGCRIKGSSLGYDNSSICRDLNPEPGEYNQCEQVLGSSQPSTRFGYQSQVVTAQGEGKVRGNIKAQVATVTAKTAQYRQDKQGKTKSLPKGAVAGGGDYFLQCGFKSYKQPKVTKTKQGNKQISYNNCSQGNSKKYGVGNNSCCYPRVKAANKQPNPGQKNVCRNTRISVEFPTYLEPTTVENNIKLVHAVSKQKSCASKEKDVTNLVTSTLAVTNLNKTNRSWFGDIWYDVKQFFADLVGWEAFAATQSKFSSSRIKSSKWCESDVEFETKVKRKFAKKGKDVTTTIKLKIKSALKGSTDYAVILQGGPNGIKDYRGVGVGSSRGTAEGLFDGWAFRTKSNICTVESVNIVPSAYAYSEPNSSTKFTAIPTDKNNARLTPIKGVYNWEYNWGISSPGIYDVPKNTNSSTVTVTSTKNEGQGILKSDLNLLSTPPSQPNKSQIFATADLSSLFCNNPWPGGKNAKWVSKNKWKKHQNKSYNFSTYFCADKGQPTTFDDLPLFSTLSSTTKAVSANLKRVSIQSTRSKKIEDIAAKSKLAVVADGKGLLTFSLEDKAHPKQISATTTKQIHKIKWISNDRLLSVQDDGLYSYNITPSGSILSKQQVTSKITDVGNAILVHQDNIYLSDTNRKKLVVLKESDLSKVAEMNVKVSLEDIAAYKDYLYGESNGEIIIYDISDPTAIKQLQNTRPHGSADFDDIAIYKGYLVGLDNTHKPKNLVASFDLSQDPLNPSKNSELNVDLGTAEMEVGNGHIYSVGWKFLKIMDITSPEQIKFAGKFTKIQGKSLSSIFKNVGNFGHMELNDDTLFMGSETTGEIVLLDVSSPAQPRLPVSGVYNLRLNKKVMFNDKNSDIVGLQVFQNPDKLSIRDWYKRHFDNLDEYRTITVDRFKGITNGTNYYINGLNAINTSQNSQKSLEVFRNIYHFSVNENSASESREVLRKLIDNLKFNTNISNFRQCMKANNTNIRDPKEAKNYYPRSSMSCRNDFDCRDAMGHARLANKSKIKQKIQKILDSPKLDKFEPKFQREITSTLQGLQQALDKNYTTFNKKKNKIKGYFGLTKFEDSNLVNKSKRNTSLDKSSPIVQAIHSLIDETSLKWTSGVCSNARDKLLRDLDRLDNINQIQQALRNNSPEMKGGTYYPGYTNSRWPSWQVLGRRANGTTLPQDPVNEWTKCSAKSDKNIDPRTCWNPDDNTFYYPKFSQIYEYKHNSYELYGNLEYFEETDDIVKQRIDTKNFLTSTWKQSNTPLEISLLQKGQCGDGVVQSGEQCDPPGSFKQVGPNKFRTCKQDCTLSRATTKKSTCGNGIVEQGENCDDGALNGQYGQCASSSSVKKIENIVNNTNKTITEYKNNTNFNQSSPSQSDKEPQACQGPYPQYCGNNILDVDKDGNAIEVCETVSGSCVHSDGSSTSTPCSSYATSSVASCASDCQSLGGYCGDGIEQPQEECDDGNNNNNDDCRNDCTKNKNKQTQQKKSDGPAQCGNGIIEKGEACDQGSVGEIQNGKKCDPEYGKSCTYCSADCKNVLTVDPVGYCSNGKIDQVGTSSDGTALYETCDVRGETVVAANKVESEAKYCAYPDATGGLSFTDNKCRTPSDCSNGGQNNKQTSINIEWVKIDNKSGSGPNSIINVENDKEQKTKQIDNTGQEVIKTFNFNSIGEIKLSIKDISRRAGISSGVKIEMINVSNNSIQSFSPSSFELTENNSQNKQNPNPFLTQKVRVKTDQINIQTNKAVFCKKKDISETKKVSCSDKGSYVCTNQCQTLQNNCVSCKTFSPKQRGEGAIPQISILNPLIAGNSKASAVPKKQRKIKWTLALFRSTTAGNNLLGELEGYNQRKTLNGYTYQDPAIFKNILRNHSKNHVALKSDKLCNGGYKIALNGYSTSNPQSNNDITIQARDSFPYPVHGEGKTIYNTIISSPPVPKNSLRVVVKWGENITSNNSKAYFGGNFFLDSNSKKELKYSKISKVCQEMRTTTFDNQSYYWPNTQNNTCKAYGNNGANTKIYFHNTGSNLQENIQSMTVNLRNVKSNSTIPFYVTAEGEPIEKYQNSDIQVLVYTNHDSGDPLGNRYKPTYKFNIKKSLHSVNPLAKFWHVFNIKTNKNGWKLVPVTDGTIKSTRKNPRAKIDHGRIITRLCQIKADATGRAPKGCF